LPSKATGTAGLLTKGDDRPYGAVVGALQTVLKALTIPEFRLALSDFDNVAVRIPNIATPLAVLVQWFCDELGSSTFP
jgi:hypothetical protein